MNNDITGSKNRDHHYKTIVDIKYVEIFIIDLPFLSVVTVLIALKGPIPTLVAAAILIA